MENTVKQSKTQQIYGAYLLKWNAEHQNVVQPVIHQYQAADAVAKEAKSGKLITTCCKFWNGFGEVMEMADGRVIEVTLTSSRMFSVTATFPTKAAWDGFDKPMTVNQYFGRW